MVEFGPARTVIVSEGTIGLVAASVAFDVPVSIKFGLKCVAAGRANGMEHAAIVAFTEIKANHGFDLFDDGTADISAAQSIGGLVHKAVNQSGDKELSVEVLRLERARFSFNAEDHGLSVLFVEFDHFAEYSIANGGLNDWFGGCHGNGITLNVDIANDGGDDVSSCNGGTFAVFVFAFLGDDASRGDEARRHNSHSIRRHGPK